MTVTTTINTKAHHVIIRNFQLLDAEIPISWPNSLILSATGRTLPVTITLPTSSPRTPSTAVDALVKDASSTNGGRTNLLPAARRSERPENTMARIYMADSALKSLGILFSCLCRSSVRPRSARFKLSGPTPRS